jgi:Ni,Fe-hydrogenase I cytochrome b subunit
MYIFFPIKTRQIHLHQDLRRFHDAWYWLIILLIKVHIFHVLSRTLFPSPKPFLTWFLREVIYYCFLISKEFMISKVCYDIKYTFWICEYVRMFRVTLSPLLPSRLLKETILKDTYNSQPAYIYSTRNNKVPFNLYHYTLAIAIMSY